MVDLGKSVTAEFHKDELEPSEELKALKKKSQENCSNKGGNNCECGNEKNGK